jgi:hypothetical protein
MQVLLFQRPLDFSVNIQVDSGMCGESACHFDIVQGRAKFD